MYRETLSVLAVIAICVAAVSASAATSKPIKRTEIITWERLKNETQAKAHFYTRFYGQMLKLAEVCAILELCTCCHDTSDMMSLFDRMTGTESGENGQCHCASNQSSIAS